MGLVLSGCYVHCQQPVKMLRLKSGTPVYERERERERVCVRLYVCSYLRENALSGSCVVWMLRPLSATCQDVPSYVRYPEFTRERERECVCMYVCSSLRKKAFEWVLCCLDVMSTVNSLSRCSVLSQVPRFTRERECVYVCMCVAVCERKPLSGSCVVWMLRPLSAACQDAPS